MSNVHLLVNYNIPYFQLLMTIKSTINTYSIYSEQVHFFTPKFKLIFTLSFIL